MIYSAIVNDKLPDWQIPSSESHIWKLAQKTFGKCQTCLTLNGCFPSNFTKRSISVQGLFHHILIVRHTQNVFCFGDKSHLPFSPFAIEFSQKLIFNAISSIAEVSNGRVFGNRMINMGIRLDRYFILRKRIVKQKD